MIAITQVRFSHNPLKWLNKRMPVRAAMTVVDHEMKGSVPLEVVADTKRVNGFYEAEHLNRLETLGTEIGAIDRGELFVGKTLTVSDILKESEAYCAGIPPLRKFRQR